MTSKQEKMRGIKGITLLILGTILSVGLYVLESNHEKQNGEVKTVKERTGLIVKRQG